jgi:hypothetical protein
MKSLMFKNPLFTLLMLALTAFTFASCDREDETVDLPFNEALVGTWDITSYIVDNDEWVGFIIEGGFVTFEAPVGNSGIFSQEVTFLNEEPVSLSGRYVLDETEGRLTMYYEGEPIVADIVITGDKMHWESLQDEFPLVIEATKR